MTANFDDFPEAFRASARPDAPHYRIRRDCFAGRAGVPGHGPFTLLQHLPGDDLDVFAAPIPDFRHITALDPRPVYSREDDPMPAVPTGLVFVQGRSPEALQAAIESLGYVLREVPPYAPGSAWIADREGSIAAALSGLAALFRLTALLSAEAQMLRPAARR